ncbi:nematocyst expressed protein 3-like isoform X2 [Onychostoma macrolepis]|uniref:nematocyst expressed protein 3-like isoform X2 n=1 Tax=Onychostoma macrolepis TaxID=369639 RepID=UPI00272AB4FE|nr:nematocyst expressed protein 3-like isoform X2 [Onychostoma macrolepis]XP_058609841.1 nematocyst expressed protein 3-like isoform X2 [Onychostoma macrolepis]
MSKKSHKALGDDEWMSRLRRFASTGVWPSEAGNRPAPRQKKWFDLFHKIDKCPMQVRGQSKHFGGAQKCLCGFHPPKATPATTAPPFVASAPPATSASPVAAGAPPATSASPAATPSAVPASTSAPTIIRPALTLSMLNKSRFGGSISLAAKPNVNVPRRIQPGSHSPSPSASPSSASSPSLAARPAISSSPAPSTIPSPEASPTPSPRPAPSSRAAPSISPVPSSIHSPSSRPAPSSSPFPAASPALRVSEEHIASSMPSPTPVPSPVSGPSMAPVPGPASASEPDQFWLPVKMRKTIPSQDQNWISSALFHAGRLRTDLKLWYEPPVPSLIYHQAPTPDRFFNHRLLVWMPYHLWKFRLSCPTCGKQLTGYDCAGPA